MGRISRDEMFMEIARTIAKRSTCTRKSVGAVLVKDNRIISTGYNGAPSGVEHCLRDVNCFSDKSCNRVIHAEANCLAFAAQQGIATQDSILYVTLAPCVNCAKLLINSGVECVIYEEEYSSNLGELDEILPILSLAQVQSTFPPEKDCFDEMILEKEES